MIVIRTLFQICISFVFLIANVLTLLAILAMNRRVGAKPGQTTPPPLGTPGQALLDPADILKLEFEYARTTASEAMQDRHTMVNFYLLVAGVMVSGVVGVLVQKTGLPKVAGTLLLWLLCGIGWLYFLKIIRLRQAWHDSARAMNKIKDFYIQQVKDFKPDELREAFVWKTETLPPPDRPWTLFFYSAALIGLLDSVAYVAGGALLDLTATRYLPSLVLGSLTLLGLAFFAFHVWLYSAFLKPERSGEATRDVPSKDG
ncbi:MAG: hypothetical protein ISS50_02515 [Anaerolineae bacterium]|nr:hypothetical protein [Anaerolineae bacterium]